MSDIPTVAPAPRFADGDPMRVIGLSERYTDATRDRIPDQWAHLQQRLGEVRGRTDPAQFGLLYQIGESPFEFEYVTGVMVDANAALPAGFVERRLPRRRHAVFTHRGDLSGLRPLVHTIFREWLPQSGYEAAGNPLFTEGAGPGGEAMVAINLRCAENVDISRIKITQFDGASM
jgi:AraC family transcriptional regulator